MFCPKCGEKNIEGAKSCSKCGATFDIVVKEHKTNSTKNNTNQENVISKIFKHMILAFIKPFKAYDENKEELSKTSTSLIYAGIVSGIMWILSIISSIFVSARTVKYGLFGTTVTTFDFGRVNYVKVIFGNLFVYTGLVAATAGVFTLACLIAKKKGTFFKFLAITSTAIVPYALANVFLAPLFGMLHVHIQSIISLAGIVYSFLIFIGLVNDEIEFKSKETKLLFYFACIGSLCIVFHFIFYYIGISSISLGSYDLLF